MANQGVNLRIFESKNEGRNETMRAVVMPASTYMAEVLPAAGGTCGFPKADGLGGTRGDEGRGGAVSARCA